jgi:hypothetical protein
LNNSSLKCHIKVKKPLLTHIYKEKRKKFAENFKDYSYSDWKKVIWSDECKFALQNTNKKEFYWKYKRDPLNDDHMKKTTKFGGGSILAWGCITSEGVGEFMRVNGNMDSSKYIEVFL